MFPRSHLMKMRFLYQRLPHSTWILLVGLGIGLSLSSWTGSLNPAPGFYPLRVVNAGLPHFADRWFLFQVQDPTHARGWRLIRFRYRPERGLASMTLWSMETLAQTPRLRAHLEWYAPAQTLYARPESAPSYRYWPWLLLPTALENVHRAPLPYQALGWKIVVAPVLPSFPVQSVNTVPMGYLRADFIDGSARWEFWFVPGPRPVILRARQNGWLWWQNIHTW